MKHDEKKIEEIKDYLKNNLGSSIEEIAEERGALFGKHISPDEIPPYVINPIIDRLKQYAEHMVEQERENIERVVMREFSKCVDDPDVDRAQIECSREFISKVINQ